MDEDKIRDMVNNGSLRSLDELTELGKQVSDLVGSSLIQSDGVTAQSQPSLSYPRYLTSRPAYAGLDLQ